MFESLYPDHFLKGNEMSLYPKDRESRKRAEFYMQIMRTVSGVVAVVLTALWVSRQLGWL